jgi:hypothetical protein
MLTTNKKLCINSEHKLLYYTLPCLHHCSTQETYYKRIYVIKYAYYNNPALVDFCTSIYIPPNLKYIPDFVFAQSFQKILLYYLVSLKIKSCLLKVLLL